MRCKVSTLAIVAAMATSPAFAAEWKPAERDPTVKEVPFGWFPFGGKCRACGHRSYDGQGAYFTPHGALPPYWTSNSTADGWMSIIHSFMVRIISSVANTNFMK